MSGKQQYKRRNYFIKKDFQGKHVFLAFALVVAGTLLFAGIFSLITSTTLSVSYDDYTLRVGTTPRILFSRFFTAEWLFIILGGVGVAVLAVFLSHRVAGPLYKLERSVNGMISGNIGETIYLRRRDEGKELAVKLNQFNEMLSAKIQEMRHLNKGLERHLQELMERAEKDLECDKSRIVLKEMAKLNGQMRDILYEFTIREQ